MAILALAVVYVKLITWQFDRIIAFQFRFFFQLYHDKNFNLGSLRMRYNVNLMDSSVSAFN